MEKCSSKNMEDALSRLTSRSIEESLLRCLCDRHDLFGDVMKIISTPDVFNYSDTRAVWMSMMSVAEERGVLFVEPFFLASQGPCIEAGVTVESIENWPRDEKSDDALRSMAEHLVGLYGRRETADKAMALIDACGDFSADVGEAVEALRIKHEEVNRTGTDEEEDECLIDLSRSYPEPEYLLKIDGVGTLPRKNLQTVKAKSKQGKSWVVSAFASVVLGKNWGTLTPTIEGCKVLFVDTEQAEEDTANLVRRIHQMQGWSVTENNPRLYAANVRMMQKKDRLRYIAQKAEKYRPDLLVVDGIADICENFNDVQASDATITKLCQMATKFNLALIGVLHENKSREDSNMKGHLGSLAVQKASDVYQVKKEEKEGLLFTVTQTEARHRPVSDFSFRIDDFGLPYWVEKMEQQEDKPKKESRHEKIARTMTDCLSEGGQTYSQLKASLGRRGIPEKTAEKYIQDATLMGVITAEGRIYTLAS